MFSRDNFGIFWRNTYGVNKDVWAELGIGVLLFREGDVHKVTPPCIQAHRIIQNAAPGYIKEILASIILGMAALFLSESQRARVPKPILTFIFYRFYFILFIF